MVAHTFIICATELGSHVLTAGHTFFVLQLICRDFDRLQKLSQWDFVLYLVCREELELVITEESTYFQILLAIFRAEKTQEKTCVMTLHLISKNYVLIMIIFKNSFFFYNELEFLLDKFP